LMRALSSVCVLSTVCVPPSLCASGLEIALGSHDNG
jgi:hypothetical protein